MFWFVLGVPETVKLLLFCTLTRHQGGRGHIHGREWLEKCRFYELGTWGQDSWGSRDFQAAGIFSWSLGNEARRKVSLAGSPLGEVGLLDEWQAAGLSKWSSSLDAGSSDCWTLTSYVIWDWIKAPKCIWASYPIWKTKGNILVYFHKRHKHMLWHISHVTGCWPAHHTCYRGCRRLGSFQLSGWKITTASFYLKIIYCAHAQIS